MSGRPAHMVSILLSLAVLGVLGLHLMPESQDSHDRLVPNQISAPKEPASPKAAPQASPMIAIKLPPPPAVKPVHEPLKPQKAAVVKAPDKPLPLRPQKRIASQIMPDRPFLKPSPRPEEPRSARQEPAADPAPKPTRTAETDSKAVIAPDEKATIKGRALLRLLEHGSGPSVEIAWPESAKGRERLYQQFRNCYGLRVAVLTGTEKLFIAQGAPGVPWQLNLDAFSGFMRQHGGDASRQETADTGRVRDLHRLGRQGTPVRIFPRHVDAVLLGGLRQAVGTDYEGFGRIRARYALRRGRVFVEDIQADGVGFSGRIDLSAALRGACGKGARV